MQSDDRFKHIGKDPRFRELRRKDRKVTIDKRFKGMFKDDQFKLKCMMDKRGKPVKKSNIDHLRRYYDIEDSDEDQDKQKESVVKEKKSKKNGKADKDVKQTENECDRGAMEDAEEDDSEDKEDDDDGEDETGEDEGSHSEDNEDEDMAEDYISSETDSDDSEDLPPKRDILRDDASSSSGDDSEDTDSEIEFDHNWAELDQNVARTDDSTCRLAVMNMDWDRIKSLDLLVLFNSFKPQDGVIKSVTIYTSDFGKQEMAQENINGPKELVEEKNKRIAKNEESDYHRETLRRYQIKRLKYFYAVLVCDTASTAAAIYDNCDGLEYETSSAKLDLRYIPDEFEFDENDVKSFAKDIPSTYKPSLFITTALQQSAVELTWDETNKDRTALTMRKFDKDKLDSMDMHNYMETSSDSDSQENKHDPYGDLLIEPTFNQANNDTEKSDEATNKYKSLLLGLDGDGKDDGSGEEEQGGMEVTWGGSAGLKEKAQELIQKKQESLSPWEQYLQRKHDKKRQKRELNQLKNQKTEDNKMGGELAFSDDCEEDADLVKQMKAREKKGKNKKHKITPEEEETQEKERAELSLLMMDEDEDKAHFNLKDIQDKEKMSKRKRRKLRNSNKEPEAEDTFKMDIADDRFSAVYTNPEYNIEPASHEFKKTNNMESLIDEKIKRKTAVPTNSAKSNNSSCKEDDRETLGINAKKSVSNSEDNLAPQEPQQAIQRDSIDHLIKSVKSKTKLKFYANKVNMMNKKKKQ